MRIAEDCLFCCGPTPKSFLTADAAGQVTTSPYRFIRAMLWEMDRWLETYVKNAKPRPGE